MNNQLEKIIAQKRLEVLKLTQHSSLFEKNFSEQSRHVFKSALRTSQLAVIAEIKRKSPSKGQIAEIDDPTLLAKQYMDGGANALSILTDTSFFAGTNQDLMQVRNAFSAIPILRKDFIIDQIQVAEAKAIGANAILAIVAVLGNQTKNIIEYAHSLQLDVLVEIVDETELAIALDSGAEIIGINNRDLKQFAVNPNRSLKLIEKIPNTIVTVAESGITSPEMAQQYYQAGFNAVLIGEALVRSANPQRFIQECKHG